MTYYLIVFRLALRAYYEQQELNFHTPIRSAMFEWISIFWKLQYDYSRTSVLSRWFRRRGV